MRRENSSLGYKRRKTSHKGLFKLFTRSFGLFHIRSTIWPKSSRGVLFYPPFFLAQCLCQCQCLHESCYVRWGLNVGLPHILVVCYPVRNPKLTKSRHFTPKIYEPNNELPWSFYSIVELLYSIKILVFFNLNH